MYPQPRWVISLNGNSQSLRKTDWTRACFRSVKRLRHAARDEGYTERGGGGGSRYPDRKTFLHRWTRNGQVSSRGIGRGDRVRLSSNCIKNDSDVRLRGKLGVAGLGLTALPASIALLFLTIHPARAKLLPSQRQFPAPATAGRTFSHWGTRVLPPSSLPAFGSRCSPPEPGPFFSRGEFKLARKGSLAETKRRNRFVRFRRSKERDSTTWKKRDRTETGQKDRAGWLISSLFACFARDTRAFSRRNQTP